MPRRSTLLADLQRWFPVVDAVDGWEERGVAAFAPVGVVCHWTAGPRGTVKRASLNVVTNGRAGLPGPLCNVYLDRAGIPVVVAAGRANHAGPGTYAGMVGNSAVFGIEAESAGDGDWTEAQERAYPRLVAALLESVGRPAEFACGHNEWAPTRKIDIRDWPMAGMRASVADLLADRSTEGNGFMAGLTAAEQRAMYDRVMGGVPGQQARDDRRALDSGDGDAIVRAIADVRRVLDVIPRREYEGGALVPLADSEDVAFAMRTLVAEIGALKAAVALIQTGEGVDGLTGEQVAEAARRGALSALATLRLSVASS